MTSVATLYSGSSGNASYFGDGKAGFLVDAGKNAKCLTQGLGSLGLSLSCVKAIFVTHSHSDHISALKVVTNRNPGITVAATPRTLEFLADNGCLGAGTPVLELDARGTDLLDYHIAPFDTPHDAPGSCGFVITTPGGEKIGVCTDLGHVTDTVLAALSGCRTVVIESNHDVEVLKAGPYPYYLKRRILGQNGHLCNADCAGLAATLMQRGCRDFVLAHLSEQNNLPQLAYETTLQRLLGCGGGSGIDFRLTVASADAASKHYDVR